MIQSTLKLYFISFDLINLREILYLQQLNTYVLSLQEAYVYWACSTELPLWLRHQNGKVKNVSTCSNVCLEVEKSCPFHVKDRDLDTASGNPAFLCQGG